MKAVITAAGYGTRMLPITKVIPKEMLPVWTKPVIHYIVEWISNSWLKDIVIITSQWKSAIQDYFDKNYELEDVLKKKNKLEMLEQINSPKKLANLTFMTQKQMLGFANALLEVKPWINDDFFLLSVGDTIFDEKIFSEIIALHQKTKKPVIWLQNIPREEVYKYWVVDIQNWKIVDIVEKPAIDKAPSTSVAIWVYVLPRSILDIIEDFPVDEKLHEVLLTDVMKSMFSSTEYLPYITTDPVWDVGTPELWLKANISLMNK